VWRRSSLALGHLRLGGVTQKDVSWGYSVSSGPALCHRHLPEAVPRDAALGRSCGRWAPDPSPLWTTKEELWLDGGSVCFPQHGLAGVQPPAQVQRHTPRSLRQGPDAEMVSSVLRFGVGCHVGPPSHLFSLQLLWPWIWAVDLRPWKTLNSKPEP